jgi:hypothetical protein
MFPFASKITLRVFRVAVTSAVKFWCFRNHRDCHRHRSENLRNSAKISGKSEMIRESNDGVDGTGGCCGEGGNWRRSQRETADSGRMEWKAGGKSSNLCLVRTETSFRSSSKAVSQPVRGDPQQFIVSEQKPRRRVVRISRCSRSQC